jgi:hypothetical protein
MDYIGAFALIAGFFLVLAGLDVIKIQQVSVTPGRKTWGFGLFLVVFGVIFLLPQINKNLLGVEDITPTPTGEALAVLPTETAPPAEVAVTETPTIITATATQTLEPAPTDPPVLEPTLIPTNPSVHEQALGRVSTWQTVLRDDFFDASKGWPTGNFSDTVWTTREHAVTAGVFRSRLDPGDQPAGAWVIPNMDPVQDFFLSVEAQRLNGPAELGAYGVAFRFIDGNNHYFFVVRDDQFYSFGYYEASEFIRALDWTPSEAIRPGEVNTLAVLGEGSHFTFFINEEFAAETDDTRFERGITGLVMNVNDAPQPYQIDFDNFELRSP